MSESSWAAVRQQVHSRAGGCCEYCLTSEENSGETMQVDHIDPAGGDALDNLCLSCWSCNNYKRAVTTAKDDQTGDLVPLFNPRLHAWPEHFEWIDGATRLRGLTPTGRATVVRLKINRDIIVIARGRWAKRGFHPPK